MVSVEILLNLLLLFLSFAVSFILYPIWIDFVYKFQMGESVRKDGPVTHAAKIGTPTMGGLVFVVTVALVTVLLNRSRTQTLFPLFIACLGGLLGLLEDFTKVYRKSGLPGFFEYHFRKFSRSLGFLRLRNSIIFKPWFYFKEFWRVFGSSDESGIQTYQKFIFQALTGAFVAYWVYFKLGWDYLWFPLLGDVHLGFLYPVFVFLMFIMVLNAFAFSDGLDGLSGGLAMIAFTSFWVISEYLGYKSLSGFCATFIGALLPFMYFNVFPARVFMGNVGSYVLGSVLGILAIVMHREIAFFIIGLPFLVDGITSPLQQLSVKFTGKRLFRMAPLHHHFELLGWHESKVTFRFYLFGIFFAFAGIFVALM
jgi:phospho-N-acetylmuramoyl-pentapeptide-transferase